MRIVVTILTAGGLSGGLGSPVERQRLAAAATARARIFTRAATCDRTIRELERSVS